MDMSTLQQLCCMCSSLKAAFIVWHGDQKAWLHSPHSCNAHFDLFQTISIFMVSLDKRLVYQLPHPLSLLQEPFSSPRYKKLVQSRVIDHWEVILRAEAAEFKSLEYFKPNVMSLSAPHPIWSSFGSNPFKCHKAITAALMLSGRYLTDKQQRHWTGNKSSPILCSYKD